MRLKTWRLFCGTIVAVLICGFAHGAKRSIKPISIPFVGCPSFGQTEVLQAPKGVSEPVPIEQHEGQALAYYKSGDGISVLGPRGWYCQGVSGSEGAALFLGPKPIRYSSAGWEGLDGAVIEVNDISGENSGRYEIAELIARIFPAYQSFSPQVWDDRPLPSGPYPKDTIKYRGNAVVEYRTPPQEDGLGNFDSWLGRSDLPIAGAAILLIDSTHSAHDIPHLILLSIRFPPDLVPLAPAIIRHVERESAGATHK